MFPPEKSASQRRSVAESTHDVLVREDPRHRVRIGYGDSLNPAYRCQPLALLCIVGVLLQARLVEFCVEYRTGLPDLKVHIAGITPGPEGPFMMQVGRNLTDPSDGFLRGKRFLILDRDKKFTTEFRDLLEHAGTDVIRLPHRSPNLNAYVERFVLSIKSECLERMIFFSEPSLRRAVAEFIYHYHGERNHQGLGNALLEAEECVGSPHGKVLALFAVGDVYVSLCKKSAYAPFKCWWLPRNPLAC